MFLKAKEVGGDNVLVNVEQIEVVTVTDAGTDFVMKSGITVSTSMGFQSVTNRLADLGVDVAK